VRVEDHVNGILEIEAEGKSKSRPTNSEIERAVNAPVAVHPGPRHPWPRAVRTSRAEKQRGEEKVWDINIGWQLSVCVHCLKTHLWGERREVKGRFYPSPQFPRKVDYQ